MKHFLLKYLFSTSFEQKESFWKSVEYLWWYSIFYDKVYMFESGKISNVCPPEKSFHLAIAKLK